MKRIAISSLLLLAGAAAVARGADPFVVTLDDFSRRALRVEAFDGQTLSGVDVEQNAPAQVPASRLLVMTRPAATAAASDGAFVLSRTDGQQLVGKPGAIRDDALRFSTPLLGEWQVPLTAIVSLNRADDRRTAAPPATPLTQDELRLTNGDAVVGIISEATDERVTCRAADGQLVPVEWANVRQLRFAQAAADAPPTTPAFRLRLSDGSRVGVSEPRIEAGRLRASAGDRAIDVDADAVVRIESLGGSTRLLSNVPPTASSSAPFFPRFAPADAATRAASVAAAHGATSAIAARPRSTMTWATGGAKVLHARYVIPAGLPRADVSIRVLADDRVVFERQHVRAGEASPPIDVPLESAKSVTLEVDFGDGYDAQDEFYWLDAALVGVAEQRAYDPDHVQAHRHRRGDAAHRQAQDRGGDAHRQVRALRARRPAARPRADAGRRERAADVVGDPPAPPERRDPRRDQAPQGDRRRHSPRSRRRERGVASPAGRGGERARASAQHDGHQRDRGERRAARRRGGTGPLAEPRAG